jgi:protein-disulfide isomerase
MSKKRSRATREADSQRAAQRAAAIRKTQESKERRRRTLVVGAVLAVLLALVFGIGLGVVTNRDTTGRAATPPRGAVDSYAVPAGTAGAPVSVTIYEDFMCPFCGDLESVSRTWIQQYVDQGKIRVKYHVVNILDGESSNSYSTRAANALAAVLNSSGPTVAKKFHDLLYESQPKEGSAGLSDNQLVSFAVQAGAKQAVVARAVKAGTFDQWVRNGTNAFSKAGYNSTPTVLVDGKKLDFTTIEGLNSALQKDVDSKLS